MSQLVDVARRGDASAVKKLLKKPSQEVRAQLDSALRHAAMMGHVEVAKILIENGASARGRGQLGRTALMTAVQCTNSERTDALIPLLLQAGARINHQDDRGGTPLMLVCEFGKISTVHTLLSLGADVNLREREGNTALHVAAQGSSGVKVAALLSAGADANAATTEGATPLMIAACHGNQDAVLHIIRKNANINLTMRDGQTALHLACTNRQTHIVRLLLQNGADADVQNAKGRTALYEACTLENAATVKILLQHEADADLASLEGNTPLHAVCAKGNVEIAGLLLDAVKKPDAANHEGETPLMWAAQCAAPKVSRLLLESGRVVNPDARDIRGNYVLHHACAVNCLTTVEVLLEHNAHVSARDSDKHTPLYKAALAQHMGCMRALLHKRLESYNHGPVTRTLSNKAAPANTDNTCMPPDLTIRAIEDADDKTLREIVLQNAEQYNL